MQACSSAAAMQRAMHGCWEPCNQGYPGLVIDCASLTTQLSRQPSCQQLDCTGCRRLSVCLAKTLGQVEGVGGQRGSGGGGRLCILSTLCISRLS